MDYGLLGVFLAVFLSHFIPFFPLPGYIATVAYVAAHGDLPHIAAAVVATALGAALGKVAVFLYGYGIGKAVMGEELQYAKRFFDRVSKWGLDLAVFIFAVSPLADDVLYIPLGAAGYSLRRFFLAVFAGKLVLSTAIALFADAALMAVESYTGDVRLGAAAVAAITAAATFLVLRIKWSRVLAAYEDGGLKAALREALRSIARRK